ncbi:preprotein translocase subunit SecY [Chloracidobacterium validum]|uniref:Protein translocase subunit SecY n=1 Tax=Chloracidobacterium validum TaxID=2821543 RepID=A0ABX8B979_9BACT|nr:preprotein translocase subunit SecY [Chloracidobacterium validum]QUW03487.1 preprotein translocase subunit SecY [Chloracidobacterium validum]
MSIIDTTKSVITNIAQSKDVRSRLIFALGMLLIYRLGSHVRVPGIDQDRLKLIWQNLQGSLVGVLDLFSGGNLKVISIFALGITPYITASIVIQLLTVAIPSLKKLQEEGDAGRRKINQYTRYSTIGLSLIQSTAITFWILSQPGLVNITQSIFVPVAVITLTTGTALVMWIGEQITERGIGNGISLLIFAGIVVRFPSTLLQFFDKLGNDPVSALESLLIVALLLALVITIVFVEKAYRAIPIEYAKRKMEGSQSKSSYIPLKINMSGVIPVIFASSLLAFPLTIAQFSNVDSSVADFLTRVLRPSHPIYELVFTIGIIFFSFFYVSVIFDVQEVSNNLRKYGSYIPTVRPGKSTADYLSLILNRLTLVGAIYLSFICFVPQFIASGLDVAELPIIGDWLYTAISTNNVLSWIVKGFGYTFYFGGTSLLIAVGVSMDTAQQVEARLLTKKYESSSGVRVRGRRALQEANDAQ